MVLLDYNNFINCSIFVEIMKKQEEDNKLSFLEKSNEDFFEKYDVDEDHRRKVRKFSKEFQINESKRIKKIQLEEKKKRDKETQSPEHLIKIITLFAICILGYLFLS